AAARGRSRRVGVLRRARRAAALAEGRRAGRAGAASGRRRPSVTLLRAAGVARRFGDVEALAPTDVELGAGECVALVGPNGAGKSTLLALLAGALEATAGSVESDARVGWVPQRPAHYPRLSARENLVLFARLARVQADVDALLARFELPADRLSGEL